MKFSVKNERIRFFQLDASQEHQGLTGNDWNTGVVAKASKAQFHESNKENETNNNRKS